MTTINKVADVLSAYELKHLQQVTNTQRKVIQAYYLLSEELKTQILMVLGSRAKTGAGTITAAQSAAVLYVVATRLTEFNKALGTELSDQAKPLADLTEKQVARELRTLGTPKSLKPTVEQSLIKQPLSDAFSRITGWNDNIGKEYLALIRSGIANRETQQEISARISTLGGYKNQVHPVARARAHALQNVRYAVVSGVNAAKLDGYQQAGNSLGEEVQKMWWTAPGCCHSCSLLHGQVASLDADFTWKSLSLSIQPWKGSLPHPPLHPNCRCRLIPVLGIVAILLKSMKDRKLVAP